MGYVGEKALIKTVFRVTLPDELLQPLMQAIRDFDMAHDPNHESKVRFESLSDADWPIEKMAEVMKAVTPQPQYLYMKKFDKADEPEIERLRKENDYLRGVVANSDLPCLYCGLSKEDMIKCYHGFPGCPRADDILCAPPKEPS
jgi:hypothetical protein